jgi:pimeloyl-ACP methyl ester carboxylesterase
MMRLPLLAMIAALACALPAHAQPAAPGCADDRTRWAGPPGGCLALTSYGPARAEVLIVVLHGDVSGGGPARYHRALAERIATTLPGTRVVALVRPGYPDGEGRVSDGQLHGRQDHYTAENVAIVAGAVAALRTATGARRVVAVGHSGGAATSALLLALHPGTLDAAALIACPCQIFAWRHSIGARPWTRSTDPEAVADRVPAGARVAALTGRNDVNTRPAFGAGYTARLAARGVAARFAEVPGAEHNDVVTLMWDHGFADTLRWLVGDQAPAPARRR